FGSGDQMGQVRIRADQPWPQRRASPSRTVACVLAAVGFSAAVAAWVVDPGDAALVSANAAPSRPLSSFEDRFLPEAPPQSMARNFSSSALSRAELQAREQLARQMQSQDWQGVADDEPASQPATASTSVPLPRARPSDTRLETTSRATTPA